MTDAGRPGSRGRREAAAIAGPLVSVDLTFALDAALGQGRGIATAALDGWRARAAETLARTEAERREGRLAFLDLPSRDDLIAPVLAWARTRRRTATDVLLVGIGGSSRTAEVLDGTVPRRGRGTKGRPRLHVLDTVDPARVEALLADLRPGSTILVAVSKAGTTMETVAGFLLAEAWMERRLGRVRSRDRIALVAGEEANPLRARAESKGYECFPVPKGVGGRFSGLSPVGLLPAALAGVDVPALLAGAKDMTERASRPALQANPPFALAAIHHLALAAGRTASVCLPYAESLQPFALWWEQLLGESLGKTGANGPVGVTPLPGVGPSDQHSLLQLLIEGPDDKLTVFVETAGAAARGLRVPAPKGWPTPVAGHRLGAILAAEREATEVALAERGRPSIAIRLEDAKAASVGALLRAYEIAVVWWGWWMGIDPFGQPGVERGKVVATASLTGSPAEAAASLARHRATPRVTST